MSQPKKLNLLPLLGPETKPTRPPPARPPRTQLVSLPKDLIYKILSDLNPVDLSQICQSSTELARICNSDEFWNFKHTSTMGSLPKPRDKRLVFYERRAEQLDKISDQLIGEIRNRITNLIFSILKKPPTGDDPESKGILRDVGTIANTAQGRKLNETNTEFQAGMLHLIRSEPLPGRRRPGTRVPPRKKFSEHFESWINPDANLFKMYPFPEYNFDPVEALIQAIYDIKSEYVDRFVELIDEVIELSNQLDALREQLNV